MRKIVTFVIAILATSAPASATNFDCRPSLRNGSCPLSQRRADKPEPRKVGSSQKSLPLKAVGVWGFSEIGCELYKTHQPGDEYLNAHSINIGIISITSSTIGWMNWEAASCALSTSEISTSQSSISFPAHCTSKTQESGQFIIINMHGSNSMRLTFLADRPFFKAEEYVRCTTSQTAPLNALQESRELKKVALHEKQVDRRKQQAGLRQRSEKAMTFEHIPASRNQPRGKIAAQPTALPRKPRTQTAAVSFVPRWNDNQVTSWSGGPASR
jgi:hypothetical protein